MTDNTLKPYVIGLDLGGTNSVFGIVDARGEIKATTAIKTGGYEKVEDYVKAAVEALQPIIDTVGGIDKIKAMGIGAPNANYYNGTIEFAPNLPWAHDGVVPLADLFSKALGGLPVGMTNDANAAALGEMTYGVARGMKNFIDVTLGTGVGSGIVINGQMVYGCDGFAGELGHVTMVRGKEGRTCGCGRTGCLEAYCFKSDPMKNMHKSSNKQGTLMHNGITAFLVTLSNPLIVFLFMATFAQFAFVVPDMPVEMGVGYLSIVFGALLWWFGLTWLVDKIRNKFDTNGIVIINKVIGSVVIIFSIIALFGTIFNLYHLPEF
jgi:predicted NBD/HSP70 family sugar kinase